jgi:hypothetical protein
MVKEVTGYEIRIYGTQDGWAGTRSLIILYNGETAIGYIRFREAGADLPNDSQSGSRIVMYLPVAQFNAVVDVLRNEKPIYLVFTDNHAFLSTSTEPVGEGEGPL